MHISIMNIFKEFTGISYLLMHRVVLDSRYFSQSKNKESEGWSSSVIKQYNPVLSLSLYNTLPASSLEVNY